RDASCHAAERDVEDAHPSRNLWQPSGGSGTDSVHSLLMSFMIPRQSLQRMLITSYESNQWQRLPQSLALMTQSLASG
ncbi:mCG1047524, partial [Mus musculus]